MPILIALLGLSRSIAIFFEPLGGFQAPNRIEIILNLIGKR